MDMPQMPAWAYQEEQKLDEQFNEISGISEVSKGQLPSASIPALGMQILIEADDTRIGVMTEQHEHSYAKVGTFILDYVQRYYKTYRKINSKLKAITSLKILSETILRELTM